MTAEPLHTCSKCGHQHKRDYVVHRAVVLGPETDEGTMAVSGPQSLMLLARMLLKAGASMWVVSEHPVKVKHRVERP